MEIKKERQPRIFDLRDHRLCRLGLRLRERPPIAIEVDALMVLPLISNESGRIESWKQSPVGLVGEMNVF